MMKTKLILSLLLVLYLFLNFCCLFSESPTWDEPLQLTVGKLFWRTREFILEPVEPPFARLITSLPVVIFGDKLMSGFFGQVYFWPRLVVILIGVVFLPFYFKVLKEIFGEDLAFLGLVLFIFEPNLLTHSHYNTTDFIFTVLFFISVYFLKKRSPFLPIILSFLLATKVSGFVIFLTTSLFLVIFPKILKTPPFFKLKFSFSKFLLFTFLFFIFFWACYLFKTGPAISSKTAQVGKPYLLYIFENKPFWLKIFKTPFPFIDYLATLKYAVSYQKAGFDAYFAGNYSRYGWWWYFPLTFLLKTPLPLLILFFGGILFLLMGINSKLKMQSSKSPLNPAQGKQLKIQKKQGLFYFIPVISIFFLSLFLRINQGLRHILPIYPFLIIISLFGWQWLWQKEKGKSGGRWRIFLYGLLAWYIIRTIYFLPHPITFTNELLPPSKSYKVLADSNISWGQELLAIKKWQYNNLMIKQVDSRYVNLFYFGNVRVNDYLENFIQWGCKDYKNFLRLLKGKKSPILVSATCFQKMAAHNDKKILEVKPKEIVAHSVLVY